MLFAIKASSNSTIKTSIHVLCSKIFINSAGDVPFEINSVAEFRRTGFLHNQRYGQGVATWRRNDVEGGGRDP